MNTTSKCSDNLNKEVLRLFELNVLNYKCQPMQSQLLTADLQYFLSGKTAVSSAEITTQQQQNCEVHLVFL